MIDYLKEILDKHFDLNGLIVEPGQLKIELNGRTIYLGIDKNTNPYLLYDYMAWYWTPGEGHNLPMQKDYKDEQRIVDFFEATIFKGLRKNNVQIIEEKPKEEKVITNLFDFL